MRASWNQDPVVHELREQISAADRTILEAVNRRLEVVVQLRDYKLERGYPFLDQAREEQLLERLGELNRGPLSAQGLRELFLYFLELIKREIGERADGELTTTRPRSPRD